MGEILSFRYAYQAENSIFQVCPDEAPYSSFSFYTMDLVTFRVLCLAALTLHEGYMCAASIAIVCDPNYLSETGVRGTSCPPGIIHHIPEAKFRVLSDKTNKNFYY